MMVTATDKRSYIKAMFVIVAISVFCIRTISMPNCSILGIEKGMKFCIETLVPSVFPFMFVSSFVVRSGLAAQLERIMQPITRLLFKIPGSAAATVLIGFIGGYPSAAQGIENLLKSGAISLKQAERMLCFCVCGGPAFIINVVGVSLFKNKEIGIILFLSNIIASILIGIACAFFSREKIHAYIGNVDSNINISDAIIKSTSDATLAIVNMCSFIILFSAILSIVDNLYIIKFLENVFSKTGLPANYISFILTSLTEISAGCVKAADLNIHPSVVAMILGWSGICIQLQILSMFEGISISKFKFMLYRLLHGVLSAGISYLFLLFSKTDITVCSMYSYRSYVHATLSLSNIGSICLILLSVCFTFSINEVLSKRP